MSDDVIMKIDKALAMVSALCQPRGTEGAREWIMSIPARPDHDPDLVIAEALRAAKQALHGWVRVDDRLPADGQLVSFYCPGCFSRPRPFYGAGIYRAGEYEGFSMPGMCGIPATHWKPLGPMS